MYSEAALGYTLATGKLYCRFDEFHKFCEALMEMPITTLMFTHEEFWASMRETFESKMRELLK